MLFIVNGRTHKPKQLRQGVHEYEPKRGKVLEFNNFGSVNLIELVSRSQRYQGLKGSSSMFMFMLQVPC
jgi:hypothetical protein